MIAAGLAQHPSWVLLIRDKGWQEDVRELLIRRLKDWLKNENIQPPLEDWWINCVAILKDPSTYEDLRQYLIRDANRSYTYEAIKDLPGFNLKEAVSAAWQRAKLGSSFEVNTTYPLACEVGDRDALDFAFHRLLVVAPDSRDAQYLVKNLCKYVDATGDRDALLRWYQDNKDRLAFDPARKKFGVPKTGTP